MMIECQTNKLLVFSRCRLYVFGSNLIGLSLEFVRDKSNFNLPNKENRKKSLNSALIESGNKHLKM